MNRNMEREEEFYANKNFAFSYSSLNKLLFSPSLFYKDYILQDREIRTDKHLVEGKLVHCLVFALVFHLQLYIVCICCFHILPCSEQLTTCYIFPLNFQYVARKNCCVSRSFGKTITDFNDLKEAIVRHCMTAS